jgi:hypothetical protein
MIKWKRMSQAKHVQRMPEMRNAYKVLVRDTCRPEDGGSTDLRNAAKPIPIYTALQPGRQPSSYSPLRESQIKMLVGKLEGRSPFEWPNTNIKTDLRKMEWEDKDSINLSGWLLWTK